MAPWWRRLFGRERTAAPAERSSESVVFDQTNGLVGFDGPPRAEAEPPMSDGERLHRGWAIENELHRGYP